MAYRELCSLALLLAIAHAASNVLRFNAVDALIENSSMLFGPAPSHDGARAGTYIDWSNSQSILAAGCRLVKTPENKVLGSGGFGVVRLMALECPGQDPLFVAVKEMNIALPTKNRVANIMAQMSTDDTPVSEQQPFSTPNARVSFNTNVQQGVRQVRYDRSEDEPYFEDSAPASVHEAPKSKKEVESKTEKDEARMKKRSSRFFHQSPIDDGVGSSNESWSDENATDWDAGPTPGRISRATSDWEDEMPKPDSFELESLDQATMPYWARAARDFEESQGKPLLPPSAETHGRQEHSRSEHVLPSRRSDAGSDAEHSDESDGIDSGRGRTEKPQKHSNGVRPQNSQSDKADFFRRKSHSPTGSSADNSENSSESASSNDAPLSDDVNDEDLGFYFDRSGEPPKTPCDQSGRPGGNDAFSESSKDLQNSDRPCDESESDCGSIEEPASLEHVQLFWDHPEVYSDAPQRISGNESDGERELTDLLFARREAYLMQQMGRLPHMLSFHGSFFSYTERKYWIVMEYVRGKDLDELKNENVLPRAKWADHAQTDAGATVQGLPNALRSVARLMWYVLYSLQSLHARSMGDGTFAMHDDISLRNILADMSVVDQATGEPLRYVLLDLGCAQLLHEDHKPFCKREGGNDYYCSPERYEQMLSDENSDVFSAAIVAMVATFGINLRADMSFPWRQGLKWLNAIEKESKLPNNRPLASIFEDLSTDSQGNELWESFLDFLHLALDPRPERVPTPNQRSFLGDSTKIPPQRASPSELLESRFVQYGKEYDMRVRSSIAAQATATAPVTFKPVAAVVHATPPGKSYANPVHTQEANQTTLKEREETRDDDASVANATPTDAPLGVKRPLAGRACAKPDAVVKSAPPLYRTSRRLDFDLAPVANVVVPLQRAADSAFSLGPKIPMAHDQKQTFGEAK